MTSKTNTIAEALSGPWSVSGLVRSGARWTPVDAGTLTFSGRRYLFVRKGARVSGPLLKRLPFLARRSGPFALTWRRGVTPKTVLTKRHDILATCSLGRQKFLIRYDHKAGRLYFHATVSEVQTWRIDKPL